MASIISFPDIWQPPDGAGQLTTAVRIAGDLQCAFLATLPELVARGYRIERTEAGGLVIIGNGHVLGIWQYRFGEFCYTPADNRQPTFATLRVTSAVEHMRMLLSTPETEPHLPLGRERRRHQRWPVRWPGLVAVSGHAYSVAVTDVACGGIALRGLNKLPLHGAAGIELFGRWYVEGRAVRVHNDEFGIAYRFPLDSADPMILAAKSAGRVIPVDFKPDR
ncbi:MAG TPA: hypothetical protein VJ045_02000 [Hyphomicrobiaceae bacterium]|nr:hypothetical protein [Hyphomicrobiaceae bacterium]